MLSLLHSAVRGHTGFSEGEEEECATCGEFGGELKKCLACKQVSTMCASSPQCGAHRQCWCLRDVCVWVA